MQVLASLGIISLKTLDLCTISASWVMLVVKNVPANAGDVSNVGLLPGSGRSPGRGHDNPLLCSCLENPLDRGACKATVHMLPSPSLLCSPHNRTMNLRDEVLRQGKRLYSESSWLRGWQASASNNHLTGVWMPGSFIDQRESSNEEFKSK